MDAVGRQGGHIVTGYCVTGAESSGKVAPSTSNLPSIPPQSESRSLGAGPLRARFDILTYNM